MNKKLVAFLLASSMAFQAGIASFAAESSSVDSEKTVTVNSESGERTVNKEVIVLDISQLVIELKKIKKNI